MHRQRILLAAALAAFIVSVVTMTPPNGARARIASPVTPIAAQSGFTLTSPTAGSLVPCGQPITVTWTGGNPSANVYLSLGDVQAYQVFQEFGTGPNTGSRVVTIGPGSCGRTSFFYIQDVPPTTWTYGPVFTVMSAPTPTPTPTPSPTPATCGTATYNAVTDFSIALNPSGSWSHGWEAVLGGAFTPYVVEDSTSVSGIDYWVGPENCGAPYFFPLVAFNHTGANLDYNSGVSQPANMLALHPSCTGKLSVLRWTAPSNGWFNVVGLFQGIDTRGTTTDVHIRQNSATALLGANINGFGAQAPFNFTRYLAAGETLDFIIGLGSNGNFNADSTGLAVTITAEPVPVTIPSTAGPWLPSLNSTFDYGNHDNAPPVVIDASSGLLFTPGSTLTVTYLSGTVQAGAGYPFYDANGLPGFVTNTYDSTNGKFPGFYMNPGPDVLSMELVGTFANNGVIVGRPFPIGNGPTALTIPAGANQLLLGINDNRYADNSGAFTVAVSGGSGGVAPTITSQPVSLTRCESQAATFSVTATGASLTYQWRKNGTPISSATGSTFSIAAVNAGDAGSYDIVITGACGSVNSNPATLSVNLPPTGNAGGPYRVNEGGAVTVTASGSDLEGGPLTFAWDLNNDGSFETPGQSVTFSAAALDGPSSRIIKVRVTDNCGLSAIAEAVVNIQNVAPTVGAITAPIDPIPVNTTITPSASFTDPGQPDTHTAVWNWDDPGNSSSAGAVTETNGSGSVSGSHTFTAAGVYEIKLTVTDDDGGAGQSVFQYVVVYDANGGFVTGGGWIDSPAGAYGPDQTLTGRANFGFVSKYQKGANVPTGNTEFQFKAGNFNFQSTVYEWLVVAGAKAQYKGSGKVNGAGDYGFLLTAIDGQINGGGGVDKFRIKIWDKASGVVIYDNKRGASDEIDSANPQALGGGSIVIHTNK